MEDGGIAEDDGFSAHDLFNHRANGPSSYEYDDVVFLPPPLSSSAAAAVSIAAAVSRNVPISFPFVVVVGRSTELIRSLKSLRRPENPARRMVAAAIGTEDEAAENRLEELVEAGADVVVLDGGDTRRQIEMINYVKRKYPDLDVVAGGDVLQASAVYKVAAVAAQSGIPVMADGVDISKPGHVAKALLLGASSVLIKSRATGGTDHEADDQVVENQEELMLAAMEVVKRSLRWLGASSLQSAHQRLHSQDLRLELVTLDTQRKEELMRLKASAF
ncbi:unnamed protein product [Linum tenue]|uniref:IMP dehydrogenase/GMP reductase domain-containing protein n=1 Tax=Linum tenue TaxID=586396 RepID=A0AAV0ID70_9ROSI|nr:unnamed protein product [Linum tenue]